LRGGACTTFAYAAGMDASLSCLIVGCGYLGLRLACGAQAQRHVSGLVRSAASEAALRAADIPALRVDLDTACDPATRLAIASAAHAAAVVYLAPPPDTGVSDPRLQNFLDCLDESRLPAVLVYISTTGVYGNAGGATVDEATPVAPGTDRAHRRVAAERGVQSWCSAHGVRCVILRVPGIYGPWRLPLERLQRREPALRPEDAGPGNRIHVDDLATAILLCCDRAAATGIYNVTDGDHSSSTQYLQATAAAAGLAPPPLVAMAEARERIPAGMLSFLLESRRVDNRRLRQELKLNLRYPTLAAGVRASLLEMRQDDPGT
jgi:nucleoside-diphosphate-sugar epimerase